MAAQSGRVGKVLLLPNPVSKQSQPKKIKDEYRLVDENK